MKEINSQIMRDRCAQIHLRTKHTMSFSRKNSMHKPYLLKLLVPCFLLLSETPFLVASVRPFFPSYSGYELSVKNFVLPLLMCGKLSFSHSCTAMLRLPPLVAATMIHQYPTFLLFVSKPPPITR